MTEIDLDPGVIAVALDAMDTSAFEKFGQVALSTVLGIEFEPTGGVSDGGQDGFLRTRKGRPNHFIQISKEKDLRTKIRSTITRQRETGRDPQYLTYLSSRDFPTRDQFEEEIERDLDVQLRIHDRSWLTLHIARDPALGAMFRERAASAIRSVVRIASSSIESPDTSERMSLLVYMDVHARSAPQESDLLTLATDAAIYKSLEGTDPDAGIFKSRPEVTAFVTKTYPAVSGRPAIHIPTRLERLSEKKNSPRIRWYRKEDKYCLPYDVRNELSQENDAMKAMEIAFFNSVRSRAEKISDLSSEEATVVANAVISAITHTFNAQGMNLAASFTDPSNLDEIKTYKFVDIALQAISLDNQRKPIVRDSAIQVAREVYYSSAPAEHDYMMQLFKLYSVEFVLKGDDRVASHFKGILRNLRLVVGTDIIIRALSENSLLPENRSTQNTLTMLKRAGVQLLLCGPVLQEVYTHIIAENKEFEGHYLPWIKQATLDAVRNADRILIRAYFYAYFEPERHQSSYKDWRLFLETFGSASWFDRREHEEDFGSFLRLKFGFDYISRSEMASDINNQEFSRLKAKISLNKNDWIRSRVTSDILAENDALIALYVNRQREVRQERVSTSLYGYSTWWLTEEFHVVNAAKAAQVDHKFNMHPQFLMNFFAVSPQLRELRDEFRTLFPTHFGLRITDRVDELTLRNFLKKANDAAKLEDSVARAKIRTLSNSLKGSSYRNQPRAAGD